MAAAGGCLSDSPTRELKPRKPSFLFPRVMGALVLTAILSVCVLIGAALAELTVLLVLVPVLFVLIPLPSLFAANVAYNKERYEIHPAHLVCHRGGLLSDGRTELDVKNITHVRLRLPFLRHRFWGIGDVKVESAGSAAAEITFESIVDPEAAYEEVLQLMRDNGYSLQQSETLHEESPGTVGAITDIVQVGIGGGFSVLFLLSIAGGLAADMGLTGGSIAGTLLIGLFAVGSLGTVLSVLVGLVVRYLDITRRTYTVTDDAVAYTEGFLTRDNAIIPFENIADASTNRTFVDQILGLYDVKVSCQGSGSEIHFRRLSRGDELQTAIRTLVANAGKRSRDAKKAKEAEAAAKASEEGAPETAATARKAPKAKQLVDPEDAWTAELKMNPMRAIVGTLPLFPAFPVWALAAGALFIKATRTTFRIGADSMSSDYSFIGANQQEFAYDKVTGVQVSRSPLDSLFGTFTVQIWSIGSPMPLDMTHIHESEVELPALLRQCGIPVDDEAKGELKQSFGPKVWLVQNVFGLAFLGLVVLGLFVAAIVASPLILIAVPFLLLLPIPAAVITRMRVNKQRVTFHDEHLETQIGIFFRSHTYVRYDSVKKVETTKIPLTDQGTFRVYVAGERIQQQQNGQEGAGIKIPYSVEGSYIEEISTKVDAMDALMLGLIEPAEILGTHAQDEDVVATSKPAIANTVVVMLLVGLFFPPLWLFIPIVAWQIKVKRYDIETDRVVMRGGILFKYATSVLYNRIDSLQQHQGALGKAFGNGQVTILTAGSSAPDLVIAPVPDYTEAYATIREHYGK